MANMKGNPGAQGYSGFGKAFRNDTTNVKGKLSMGQTVAKPKPAPTVKASGGKGPGMLKFGPAKTPKPAKNRAGFTTSD